MEDKKHKIEDLFSNSGPFDESSIVKAIVPFVTIQNNTNNIFLKRSDLSIDKKILVYGLAKKLLKEKKIIENEFITAAELHKKTGIKKGSIDPNFKKLKDLGMIIGKGEYEISNHKIPEVIELITGEK